MRVSNHNESEEKDEILAGTGLYHPNHRFCAIPVRGDLLFIIPLLSLIIITWLYTLSQNSVHLEALKQFVNWLVKPELTYTPLNLNGLLPAALGTIQIVFTGTVVAKVLLPELEDKFQARLVSLALGFGLTGLTVTLLGYLRLLYFASLLLTLWVLTIFFCVFDFRRKKLNAIGPYLKGCLYLWKPEFRPTKFEWAWMPATIILLIFLAAYYHAVMFPPLEFDSIIYHAPMASILFKEHGLPFITGGGVGIGSSANYPPLFSALGSYYYLWIGFVQDLFLRLITPTMGLLSILATYSLGKEVGGRKLGVVSAYLLSMVPAYLSYSTLATQETTITFFLAMGTLFLVKATSKGEKGNWITSGIFFGFALLVSYQALYFIPALILLLGYHCFRNRDVAFGLNIEKVFVLIFSMVIIGGSPYIRNWVILHNPVYPFFSELFGSEFISPWMHEYTKRSWNYVASYIATGNITPSVFHFVSSIFIYPSFYPLNFLLIFPATLVFLFSKVRVKAVILAFALIPSLAIILNQPSFIRYFWLTMPFVSVIVAWTFLRGFEACKRLQHHLFINPAELFKGILSALLSAMLIFALPVSISGYAYCFIVPFWPKPDQSNGYDYMWYTRHPNVDKQTLFYKAYGTDAHAWEWLNNNMEYGDRVATYETRIYYTMNADYEAIFSLDNMEAQELYQIGDMNRAISFLQDNHVKYFFRRTEEIEEQMELLNQLPIRKFLSSPRLPLVFESGSSKIYKVGPLAIDPVVVDPSLAYIGPNGWSDMGEIEGVVTRSVIPGSTSPRLYVVASDLMKVNIHYLDRGQGSLTINVHDPYSKRWIHNYEVIKKEDAGEWKCHELQVPIDTRRGFVELGLYAEGENFAISKICVDCVEFEGKVTLTSLEKERITNSTTPPSLMVYLPILSGGERLYVSSCSYGKRISIEMFEGYISMNMTTDWWQKHQMVTRSPELPTFGAENPSLSWEAEQGIYTLVIVLWDEYEPDMKIDFSIAIDVDSSF